MTTINEENIDNGKSITEQDRLIFNKDEPIIKVVSRIIKFIFDYDVTWVNIIPGEKEVEIKAKIGTRNEVIAVVSLEMFEKIVTRFKVLANLKLGTEGELQHGSFSALQQESDKSLHAKIAIIPVHNSEMVFIDTEFKPIDHSKIKPQIIDDLR